jgi:hypothetical protein
MKIHPINVVGFNGTLEELAQNIFRMRYDKVSEFLFYVQKEIQRQSEGDALRNRAKLSKLLLEAQQKTGELKKIMDEIFVVCKPFMKDELNDKNI